ARAGPAPSGGRGGWGGEGGFKGQGAAPNSSRYRLPRPAARNRDDLARHSWRGDAAYERSRRRIRLRGDDSLSDLPRPDRLGLVIKYLWALKGSSPSAAFKRFEVPSGNNFQLCSLSLRLATMIWSSTCSCTVGLRIGHRTSTRRSRLRGIMSADEM